MKTQVCRAVRTITLALLVAIPFTQIAVAAALPFAFNPQDDAAAQAAQQASQQAMQAAQQASQQAMQANEQASQQATQENQQAAQAAMDNTPAHTLHPNFPKPPSAFPQGPIPSQIATAHTVFLTNAGADANFPVDEDTAYTSVFAALKGWGHYQFVDSPQQADLIFSLRDIAPITNVTGGRGGVYSLTSPAFQLTIVDAKTNTPIWTVTSPVDIAGSKKARTRWFAIAVTNLVSRVKVLAAQPLTDEETADLTNVPKMHFGRNVLILTGVFVGVAAVGSVLLHNAYENSLANQKASQDQFCEAHNIPLSECAGG
jgi:hypothetical protein